MRTQVIPIPAPLSAAKSAAVRYLSCLRPQDILVLQGPPLLGAVFGIRHPSLESLGLLAILTIANVLLVAHIFMLNDWAGLTTDLADPNRAGGVFTARGVGRKEIGALTAGLLALSLLLFSRLGPITLGLALAIAALSALYSLPPFDWKGRPLLSSVAHLAGGVLHFLLGYSLWSAVDGRGLAIATFFALTFAAGHLMQEIRDHQGDVLNAIRTNAVIFGQRRTFLASLALFTLAHALLLVLALQNILPRPLAALGILYPLHLRWSLKTLSEGLTYASIRRLQVRYRALYAIVGVAMVAVLSAREAESAIVHIPTSDALSVAQIVARNEGYEIRDTQRYYFDSLDFQTPLVKGYVSIGFYINGNVRSGISISETTGQALDMTTCEIFDYPELTPFQEQILRLSKAKKKTPRELADEVGCDPPRVLTKPVSYTKEK